MHKNKKGFSLLELLIVISIVAVLGATGVGFYLNYSKEIDLKTTYNTLVSDLKQAQAKSMSGVEGLRWGVHISNADKDYYEIFSSPSDYSNISKNIISTRYLPQNIFFVDPASNFTKDIVFNKITGNTVETSVIIGSANSTKTINIFSIGIITN